MFNGILLTKFSFALIYTIKAVSQNVLQKHEQKSVREFIIMLQIKHNCH